MFPVDGGAPNRIYRLAKAAADSGDNVSVHLVFNDSTEGSRKVGNLNVITYPFSSLPLLASIATGIGLLKRRAALQGKVDVLQCEFPYPFLALAIARRMLGSPALVLDEHGVEFDFVRDVYFRKASRIRVASVRCWEWAAVRFSSHIFTCSAIDSRRISALYKVPPSKLTAVPNAVGPEFFEQVAPHSFPGPTVLFLGGFRHPPNLYAARTLKETIMPHVLNRRADVRFCFVGRDPPLWLENSGSVEVLNYVPDVRPLVSGADVCVAPILQGSGTRLKILEYMALGRPVVSTSKGVEGLDVVPNRDIVIEDDMGAFSDHIVRLLNDRAEAERLGRNARQLVSDKYRWEAAGQVAMKVYRELCSRRH